MIEGVFSVAVESFFGATAGVSGSIIMNGTGVKPIGTKASVSQARIVRKLPIETESSEDGGCRSPNPQSNRSISIKVGFPVATIQATAPMMIPYATQ